MMIFFLGGGGSQVDLGLILDISEDLLLFSLS